MTTHCAIRDARCVVRGSASRQEGLVTTSTIGRYSGFRRIDGVAPSRRSTAHIEKGRLPLEIQCVRVANVEIPNQKRIECSLTYIYGIGFPTARKILKDTGVENKRTYELSDEELVTVREEVDKYTVEGDLRRKVRADIQLLKDIGCYRGRRHSMGLPCRGQKTKTNARTHKGRRD